MGADAGKAVSECDCVIDMAAVFIKIGRQYNTHFTLLSI
jgi:hypothetical protein